MRLAERDTDADVDARLAAAIVIADLLRQSIERDGPRQEGAVAMATARWRPRARVRFTQRHG